VITVENLSCGYRSVVLQDISFSAQHDLCILGVNGVGKSTLAKALCGLIPAKGELYLNGSRLQSLSAAMRAKTITYIPPRLESYDDLVTVHEFVLMGRYPHKDPFSAYSSADEALANKLIAEYGLEGERPIGELSSGQQQLLLIAQALAQQSEIILFDEPTANLDPRHARSLYQALRSLPEGTQKVVITHDLNLARELGYEVLFLQQESATHYGQSDEFFRPETLEACYGVSFRVDATAIGVVYD